MHPSERTARCRTLALVAMAAGCAATAPAVAQRVSLDDDASVRRLWRQLTAAPSGTRAADAPPPGAADSQPFDEAIVPVAGEGLSVAVAVERRHVRSDAPSLLSPLRAGRVTTGSVAWDGGQQSADGAEVWVTGHFVASGDRALLRQTRALLGSFQVGRRDGRSYLAGGDVQPALSRLGTALGLRGVLAQRAGESFVLTAAAGTVVDTWSALAGDDERQRELRDVAALKYEHWLSPGLTVFATLQRQADRPGSAGAAASLSQAPDGLGSLRATTVTAGATYQRVTEALRGSLNAELGNSRAQRSASSAGQTGKERGNAALLEGEMAWPDVGLRAGWQRVDAAYVSPSLQVLAGQREHYLVGEARPDPAILLRAEWRAARWQTGDLMQDDESQRIERRSDSLTLGAQASLARWLPGWSVEGSVRRAESEQPAGRLYGRSEGVQRWSRAAVAYAAGGWSSQLALSRQTFRDSLYAAGSGTLDNATAQFGWQLGGWRLPALKSAGAEGGWLGLLLSHQRQGWAGLGGNTSSQWQLLLTQHGGPRWNASASLGQTQLGGWSAGPTVRLSTGSLQARAMLRDGLALDAFWRVDVSSGIVGWSASRTRQLGLQLASRF